MRIATALLSRFALCLSLCVLGVNAAAHADVPSPADAVKNTIDQVVDVVEKYPKPEDARTRRDRMREVIQPRFDFEEMAKRSLGAEWKERSADEQKDFTEIFSKLLAKTYLSRIDTVRRGMVTIVGQSVEAPRAVVRTTVANKGDTFPIDYKLLDENGNWRVYDVVIENIGLVANYRNEFAGIIRREKFDGLMRILREKAAERLDS